MKKNILKPAVTTTVTLLPPPAPTPKVPLVKPLVSTWDQEDTEEVEDGDDEEWGSYCQCIWLGGKLTKNSSDASEEDGEGEEEQGRRVQLEAQHLLLLVLAWAMPDNVGFVTILLHGQEAHSVVWLKRQDRTKG